MKQQTTSPLTEATFFILLSLSSAPKHGYAIMKEVKELSKGQIVFSTGTLYGALKRLLEQGWIKRVSDPELMIGSTLAISGGAWFFLRERQTRNRIVALLSGFMAVAIIGAISEATWDWRGYYGLPPQPPVAWYVSLLRAVVLFALWGAILFWPALVGFVRRVADKRRMA